MSTNPIQQVAQEIEAAGTQESEEIIAAAPEAFPAVTWEQKNALAGQIWLDCGGIPDDPHTLNNWLTAEDTLETQTPMK